jgi:hypothetical protein
MRVKKLFQKLLLPFCDTLRKSDRATTIPNGDNVPLWLINIVDAVGTQLRLQEQSSVAELQLGSAPRWDESRLKDGAAPYWFDNAFTSYDPHGQSRVRSDDISHSNSTAT